MPSSHEFLEYREIAHGKVYLLLSPRTQRSFSIPQLSFGFPSQVSNIISRCVYVCVCVSVVRERERMREEEISRERGKDGERHEGGTAWVGEDS
jgi:hypothetical protein